MAIPINRLKKRWMKEPGFKAGYDALEEEFTIASVLIEARTRAKLSQQQLAERMGTSQSTIARLESGTAKPSLTTLERIAKATGTRVRIALEPDTQPRGRSSRKAVYASSDCAYSYPKWAVSVDPQATISSTQQRE